MNATTIPNKQDQGILSSFQHLISNMSPETKKRLKKRFMDMATQQCPSPKEQLLADKIAGKSYSLEEKKRASIE